MGQKVVFEFFKTGINFLVVYTKRHQKTPPYNLLTTSLQPRLLGGFSLGKPFYLTTLQPTLYIIDRYIVIKGKCSSSVNALQGDTSRGSRELIETTCKVVRL